MASFEASAPGDHAKVWGQLLRSLSRVGNELFLEIYREQLVIRTLNSARSAFVTTSFKSAFFSTYKVQGDVDRCKLLLKPTCSAFKNTSNLEDFRINFDCEASSLTFELVTKAGIVKQYRINYEVCAVLQAVYSKERCPSRVLLTARPLAECLANFHSRVEEVTMSATASALQWRAGGGLVGGKGVGMATVSSFDPREFDKFQIADNVALTFSLRELKSLVTFWEGQQCAVAIHFDIPGAPIIFSGEYQDGTFETDIVIATLGDPSPGDENGEMSHTSSQAQSAAGGASQMLSSTNSKGGVESASQFTASSITSGRGCGGDVISSFQSSELSAGNGQDSIDNTSQEGSIRGGGGPSKSGGRASSLNGGGDFSLVSGGGASSIHGAGGARERVGRSPETPSEWGTPVRQTLPSEMGSTEGKKRPRSPHAEEVGRVRGSDGEDDSDDGGDCVEATPTPPD